jgi:hypothetical protein
MSAVTALSVKRLQKFSAGLDECGVEEDLYL